MVGCELGLGLGLGLARWWDVESELDVLHEMEGGVRRIWGKYAWLDSQGAIRRHVQWREKREEKREEKRGAPHPLPR